MLAVLLASAAAAPAQTPTPAPSAQASPAPTPATFTLTTVDGQTFRKAVISAVAPDGLVIMHEVGVATVKFTELPDDIRRQYGFDPARAEAFEQAAAAAAARRELEARRFYADQQQKLAEADAAQQAEKEDKDEQARKARLAAGIGMYGPGRYHWTELPTSSRGSSSFGEWQAQNRLDHALDDYNRAARKYNTAVQKDVFPQIDR